MAKSALTSPRRLVLLSFLSAALGLAGGLVSFLFLHAIAMGLSLTLLHRPGWELPALAGVDPEHRPYHRPRQAHRREPVSPTRHRARRPGQNPHSPALVSDPFPPDMAP